MFLFAVGLLTGVLTQAQKAEEAWKAEEGLKAWKKPKESRSSTKQRWCNKQRQHVDGRKLRGRGQSMRCRSRWSESSRRRCRRGHGRSWSCKAAGCQDH